MKDANDVVSAFDIFEDIQAPRIEYQRYRKFKINPLNKSTKSGYVRKVPFDTWCLVVDVFNEDNSYVLGTGLHTISPLYKSIFVPRSIQEIDYAPDDNDIGGFKFQTDIGNRGRFVTADMAVNIRVADPKVYISKSTNAQNYLKDLIIGLSRVYIGSKEADELVGKNLTLKPSDFNGLLGNNQYSLEQFKSDYGLEIVNVLLKNFKNEKEYDDAVGRTKAAEEDIRTATAERKAKKIRMNSTDELIKIAVKEGVSCGLSGSQLNEFIRNYVNLEMARNPHANVIVNSGNSSQGMNFSDMFAAFQMFQNMGIKSSQDYVDEGDVDRDQPRRRLR